MTPARPVAEVLRDHVDRLMAVEGVVGVYEGVTEAGVPCVVVMAVDDRPELRREIPERLEGHPVRIEIGGEIRPLR